MLQVLHSQDYKSPNEKEIPQLDSLVTIDYLKEVLNTIAIPRHFTKELQNNLKVAQFIADEFTKAGHSVQFHGQYRNVVGTMGNPQQNDTILIGAHYDSVPGSPGADDNGSALAVLLTAAKVLPKLAPHKTFLFVAFNCEEDQLLGSRDFVENYLQENPVKISCVHILEMVGFTSREKNSQRLPEGLPINVSDVGDFLAVVSNHQSNNITQKLIEHGGTYLHELPITVLQLALGVDFMFADILRSDHAPFWVKGIPATMWTDTSEFRNPNYHKKTDTIDTLDFTFMRQVAKLLIGVCIKS